MWGSFLERKSIELVGLFGIYAMFISLLSLPLLLTSIQVCHHVSWSIFLLALVLPPPFHGVEEVPIGQAAVPVLITREGI